MSATQRVMVDSASGKGGNGQAGKAGEKISPAIRKTADGLKDKAEKEMVSAPDAGAKANAGQGQSPTAAKSSIDVFFEKLSTSCPLGC